MRINDSEYSLNDLVKEDLHKNLHKLYGNDIYLTDNDLEILKRYSFDINKYSSVKSLILDISEYLEEDYDNNSEDLEDLLNSLAEFDYYHNINK